MKPRAADTGGVTAGRPSGAPPSVTAAHGAEDDRAVGAGPGGLNPRQLFLLGHKVDVNRDPWERITELPGLSDDVAREIVGRRKRRGPFRRAEDLLAVRGIKEKRLQKILPFLASFPNN